MNIAILGGGLTGLSAGLRLSQKQHSVTIFEQDKVLGGMASGFTAEGWGWPLEKTYHHIFLNDRHIQKLFEEVKGKQFFFKKIKTSSLYKVGIDNYRIFPVDTPQDILLFPLLGLIDKIRAGAIVAFLILSPFLSVYEKTTAAQFLKKYMGNKVWEVLWQELFRKKFGKYAENVLAPFIWARIKKRTSALGYPQEGFQSFIEALSNRGREHGIKINPANNVVKIAKSADIFRVVYEKEGDRFEEGFDAIVSTLPTPVFLQIAHGLLPLEYEANLSKIRYLHSTNLILETEDPVLMKEYWLNICDKDAPMMVMVQHTNLVDPSHYGNKHILYIANYLEEHHPLFQAQKKKVLETHVSYISKVFNTKPRVLRSFLFKTYFSQPLFTKTFPQNMPRFKTPIKNLYMANLDMTYPYDRGTNAAVKLGSEVVDNML